MNVLSTVNINISSTLIHSCYIMTFFTKNLLHCLVIIVYTGYKNIISIIIEERDK